MKRMLALQMVLLLLFSASLGFAEETEADWKERLSTVVDGLRGEVQEAAEKAAQVITEKADQLSEPVSGALGTVAEKAEEYADQAVSFLKNIQSLAPFAVEMGKQAAVEKVKELSAKVSDNLENVKTFLPQYVEQVGETAAGTLNQLSEQAADMWNNVKETAPQYAQQARDTTEKKLKELSEQVSGILSSVKSAAGQIQDIAGQKAGELAEKADGIAQAAKELVFSASSEAYHSVAEKLKALVDWLKGGEQSADPVIPANPLISVPDESPAEASDQPAAEQQLFYPIPGYGFYFGMTWKDAQALNENWLNDSRADAYARARALVMLNQNSASMYFLWFAGETEEAALFEVDEFAFSSQDTLVPPQDANGQYGFITTDATVSQVYSEKALSCGSLFGSAIDLESGLLAPSLMFDENDAGISQAQAYFPQDQAGALVVSHFIYTTDCGVNVIVYQHTDAS